MIPKVVFKEMSRNENIEVIKWAYFENDDLANVNYYTLECFPELKEISKNASKAERNISRRYKYRRKNRKRIFLFKTIL